MFDGIMPHVSGAGTVPFSYAQTTDHLRVKTDAILKRPDTDPIHTHTSTEYWQRALVHTDTRGRHLDQPDTVRIYHWASSAAFRQSEAGSSKQPP
ncbi:hypothetical protein GOA97_32145 [Sinorhizobium meliloti]|nr:hypothetical protein [Sinorhizobium meliloti]MDW9658947.1 hypothetical protein [Sinorhizobium meliloti]MDW9881698.1 hypothetical protein [Sinorhizobium meliloti]MDW9918917.1 hypothetical protein [Sinorhizobium meliloti]MDW9950016.1 hypothetical protein [Sinorhizobium meliloti]